MLSPLLMSQILTLEMEPFQGGRSLLWAILVAVLVSALGSIWMQVALGYSHGAINLSSFFRGLVQYPFNFTARNMLNPAGPNWTGWVWTAYGGA